MVSVTMSANPPPTPSPETGIVIFPVGPEHPRMLDQIHAYYEKHFRQGQMETFAQFVLEKGHGALAQNPVKADDGRMIRETWQACGRRLFGPRFIEVMERAINDYRATHSVSTFQPFKPPPDPSPPPHVLEEIPEPDF